MGQVITFLPLPEDHVFLGIGNENLPGDFRITCINRNWFVIAMTSKNNNKKDPQPVYWPDDLII
jgi:hypothetical protein